MTEDTVSEMSEFLDCTNDNNATDAITSTEKSSVVPESRPSSQEEKVVENPEEECVFGSPMPKFEPRKGNSRIILPGAIRFPKTDEVKNVIFADSQGKHIKKYILDPSNQTNIETYRGATLQQFTSKLKREIPMKPIPSIETVTIFMGGNDLAEKGMTIEKYLNIADEAVLTLRQKCPNATIYMTDLVPRGDSSVDLNDLTLCLDEWAKSKEVNWIYLNLAAKWDITQTDKIHLNRSGVRKTCYALKRTLKLPTYVSEDFKQHRPSIPRLNRTFATYENQDHQYSISERPASKGYDNSISFVQPNKNFRIERRPAQWAAYTNRNKYRKMTAKMFQKTMENFAMMLRPFVSE